VVSLDRGEQGRLSGDRRLRLSGSGYASDGGEVEIELSPGRTSTCAVVATDGPHSLVAQLVAGAARSTSWTLAPLHHRRDRPSGIVAGARCDRCGSVFLARWYCADAARLGC